MEAPASVPQLQAPVAEAVPEPVQPLAPAPAAEPMVEAPAPVAEQPLAQPEAPAPLAPEQPAPPVAPLEPVAEPVPPVAPPQAAEVPAPVESHAPVEVAAAPEPPPEAASVSSQHVVLRLRDGGEPPGRILRRHRRGVEVGAGDRSPDRVRRGPVHLAVLREQVPQAGHDRLGRPGRGVRGEVARLVGSSQLG